MMSSNKINAMGKTKERRICVTLKSETAQQKADDQNREFSAPKSEESITFSRESQEAKHKEIKTIH